MIYLGFIFDYLIMLLLPFQSYFVVAKLEKNRLGDIFIVGILLDVMYHKLFINLIILLVFYFIFKSIKCLKGHSLLKNILIYLLYFNLLYWLYPSNGNDYFILIIIGLGLQLIYLKLYKVLLK